MNHVLYKPKQFNKKNISAISIINFNRYGHVERFGMLNPKFSIISQCTNTCTIFYLSHINIHHHVSINDLNCGHELNTEFMNIKSVYGTHHLEDITWLYQCLRPQAAGYVL